MPLCSQLKMMSGIVVLSEIQTRAAVYKFSFMNRVHVYATLRHSNILRDLCGTTSFETIISNTDSRLLWVKLLLSIWEQMHGVVRSLHGDDLIQLSPLNKCFLQYHFQILRLLLKYSTLLLVGPGFVEKLFTGPLISNCMALRKTVHKCSSPFKLCAEIQVNRLQMNTSHGCALWVDWSLGRLHRTELVLLCSF